MTKVIAEAYNQINENRLKVSYTLIAVCLTLVCLYAVNVYRVIAETVALQNIETETAGVSAELNTLDAQYLELSSQITPDSLASYGMVSGKVSLYIPRNSQSGLSRAGDFNRIALSGHEL